MHTLQVHIATATRTFIGTFIPECVYADFVYLPDTFLRFLFVFYLNISIWSIFVFYGLFSLVDSLKIDLREWTTEALWVNQRLKLSVGKNSF